MSLRDVLPEDQSMIMKWRNMPEVGNYMYTDHPISEEEHSKWFEAAMVCAQRRYWIIVCDGVDVGLVNIYAIDKVNRRCSWAFYIVSSDMRGKGVGSYVEYSVLRYVFDELQLNKLCCEVFDFNEAVVKMHKHFGFKEEGVYKEHIFKKGVSYNVIALAMLQSQWNQEKAVILERLRAKGLVLSD